MPCYDARANDAINRNRGEDYSPVIDMLAKNLNRTTKLLCSVLEQVDINQLQHDPELISWWTTHQDHDRARKL